MSIKAAIKQLESNLDCVMQTDAVWCRRLLRQLKSRIAKDQPVDQLLEKVTHRLQRSAARFQARTNALPKPDYDQALPVSQRREEIIKAIAEHQVVVIAGETGSGKTTQIPKLCLEAGCGLRGLIGCTQPRRIAAQAMASRVSEELGVELGSLVGYQVRFRERLNADGYIKFMTDGILLAESTHDRFLNAYDTLIIDEAHERSLNIDFLLGYLKQLLPRRPDLKVIITSATIDTEKFSQHFDQAPVIEVSGRTYPVDVIYQPLGERPDRDDRRADRDLYQGIADAVTQLNRIDAKGDILVFLSGEREIREATDFLNKQHFRHTEVLPLFARLSSAEQQRIFHPGPLRRIVLATNVAETSLTVPRIRFVIDSGLARISRYTHRSGVQRLPIEAVSQASANQRKGRCGRLGPGTCIRLYSEEDFLSRPEYTEPEILRTSLASVILRMLTTGLGQVEDFPFVDSPAPRMINEAYSLLLELGAINEQKKANPLGKQLANWPLDVRLARMLVEGDRLGSLEDMLVLTAAMSIQDPRERPLDAQAAADEAHQRFADSKSDFVTLLKLWQYLRKQRKSLSGNQFRKQCKREFLNWQRVLEWFDLYQQLREQAREERWALTGKHGDYQAIHCALLSGLLGRVGRKHHEDKSYVSARSRSFYIFPGSGLFSKSPQWLMFAELVETTRLYARMNAVIEPQWIEAQGKHLLKHTYFDPHWSRKQGRVLAWEQVSLYGLVIVEKRRVDYTRIDPAEARKIFILEALVRGQFDTHASFLQKNRALKEQIESLEHKRRKRDVLADETAEQDFFDARLPADVNSARSFEQWIKGLGEQASTGLFLSHEVLMREDAGQAPETLYPDHFVVDEKSLPLSYLFEPGNPADGVTLTIPLEWLNTLDAGRLQWLVPGLLRDKLVFLIKSLPKPLRRGFTPAPQFADAVMQALSDSTMDSALLEQAAQSLHRMTGIEITADDFDETALPEHLRFRIQVVDDQDKQVAVGRDLSALQRRFGDQARRKFMDSQGSDYNRNNKTEWAFQGLPETMVTDAGVKAWPALVDQGEGVGLRLFDTPEEAGDSHREGVLKLLSLSLEDKIRYLRKHHGLNKTVMMVWTALDKGSQLVEELIYSSLHLAAGDVFSIRSYQDFSGLEGQVRKNIVAVCQEQAQQLNHILELYGGISSQLEKRIANSHPEVYEDMRAQLDDLVYVGFLYDVSPQRLKHYPRYLQGMEQRLERLVQDPQKDRQRMQEVAPWWQRYLDFLEQGGVYDRTMDAYRWLLEEFRVSLFAQQLGTAEKVSAKRLEQAWAAVKVPGE